MEFRPSLIRATLLGFIILGIGGRVLMRVVANMQGQPPAFTIEGSLAVIFYGTVAGAFTGIVYYLLGRYLARPWVRTAAFLIICALISWRGVHGLLPLPQLMFMSLALFYLVTVDLLGRRKRQQHLSYALTG
jgi:hypothetical protein